MADLDYERAACPMCGARTLEEASTLCQPYQTEDGDAFCDGDKADDEGFILQMSAAGAARLDAWVDAQLKIEGLL
jgi:hypothetical protein